MKNSLRAFIAAEMSPDVRTKAGSLIVELARAGAEVKWVDPENMHLTIKFLGELPVEEVPEVCHRVAEAVAGVAPFEIALRGAGAFPKPDRPRTLWLGVSDGADSLTDLAERVETSLTTLGFRRESRRFHPHLTIGRVRRATAAVATLAAQIADNSHFYAGSTAVDELVVFSSVLSPAGPTYHRLAGIALEG